MAIAVIVAAAVWVLSLTPPLRQLEAWGVDLRLSLLAPPSSARDDIVLVGIDEKVLADLPYRSPLDRGFLADLVSAVLAAKPRAVGIDILFDQPTEEAKDARLRRVLRAAETPVVVAWAGRADGLTPAQSGWLESFSQSLSRGAASLQADAFDGRVRRAAGRMEGGQPGLAGALYAAVTGRKPPAEPFLLAPARAEDGTAFRTLPGGLVVSEGETLRPWLEDRIVLIGATLPNQDRHTVAHGMSDDDLPGVEIHAHILARLLDGWRPQPMPKGLEPLLILAATTIGVFLVGLQMSGVHRALLSVAVLIAAAGAVILLARAQIMTPVVAPVQALLIAVATTRLRIAGVDRARRRFLHRAFGKYIPPALVDRLVAHPEELRLGGERREITALFTDLEGFTALTESAPPESLVGVLNAYLDGISSIIVKHGGTVDKLIGDAVVALFNAPLDLPDHPCRAVQAALDINAFSADFARAQEVRLGQRLGATRIGVATGTVTVGNFGGDVLFDYTAHGPAMNLAARLEAANRELGTTICVHERTAAACSELSFRALGTVRAKGFAEPVTVLTPTDAMEVDRDARHATTAA